MSSSNSNTEFKSIINPIINMSIELLNQSQNRYFFLQPIEIPTNNLLLYAIPTQSENKNSIYIVKSYKYEEDSKAKVDNEIKIVSKFNNDPSIIKNLDIFQDFFNGHMSKFLVMNFYQSHDIMDAGHKLIGNEWRFVSFSNEEILQIAVQSLHILKKLKDNKIVHNDIRLENFLVRSREPIVLVLTDFEFAEEIDENHLSTNSNGKPFIYPPEVLEGQPHDYSSDIWSLGVVFYQLLAQTYPFYLDCEMKAKEALEMIENEYLEQDEISDIAFQVVSCMLEKNPDDRITVEMALESEWLANVQMTDVSKFTDVEFDVKQKQTKIEKEMSYPDKYDNH